MNSTNCPKGNKEFIHHMKHQDVWQKTGLNQKLLTSLLDETFNNEDYISNFPHIFEYGNAENLVWIEDNGELAGFCTLYPATWKIEDVLVTGSCVGSVFTPTHRRGQGFGQKVLAKAERQARALGSAFLYLFSELEDFYTKAGYRKAGLERFAINICGAAFAQGQASTQESLGFFHKNAASSRRDQLHHAPLSTCTAPEFEATFGRNAHDIWKFLVTHTAPSETILPFDEFLKLTNIPQTELCWTMDGAQFAALALIGKGIDFQNIIHSSAYKDEANLFALVCQISKQWSEQNFVFMLPPQLTPTPEGLSVLECPGVFVKTLQPTVLPQEKLEQLFNISSLYPRTLQSA